MPIEQADGVYVVQVAIQNSSDTALTLTVGVLTYGSWVPQEGNGIPLPDTILAPAGALTYFNAAVNAFSSVGGSISFLPANGGSLVVSWERDQGAALTVNVSITSDTLTAQCSSINVGTLSPTAQYLVTNISS
ncbi:MULTISPECIES: hypothetical protein [Pseudomonas]|uniref:hypothetical protein n=1 Tax=Pseudomonas TaxID=286 RepID=UPI0021B6C1DD|nr:hypothetical protein [Pseudomonas citri]